jgi:hypothetical protein
MHAESAIAIVTFDDRYAPDFDRINRIWLEAGGFLEPLDEVYLANPRRTIIEKGGEIFFAVQNEAVVGTAAAIPWSSDVVELAKLTVLPHARPRKRNHFGNEALPQA